MCPIFRSSTIEEEGLNRPDGFSAHNVSVFFISDSSHKSTNTTIFTFRSFSSRVSRTTTKPSTNSSRRFPRRRIWNTVSFWTSEISVISPRWRANKTSWQMCWGQDLSLVKQTLSLKCVWCETLCVPSQCSPALCIRRWFTTVRCTCPVITSASTRLCCSRKPRWDESEHSL